MESAAEMVSDSALGHSRESRFQHRRRFGIVALPGIFQQEHQIGRFGKLRHLRIGRTVAEAAEIRVETSGQCFQHLVGLFGPGAVNDLGVGRLRGLLLQLALNERDDYVGVFAQSLRVGFPSVLHRLEQRYQSGHALLVARRIIGSAHDRAAVWREEHSQRPTAAAGRADQLIVDMQGRHVHFVDIGPLFPIDFYAHEVLVENLGDLLVHERFSLHHMTPIATRITDRQED